MIFHYCEGCTQVGLALICDEQISEFKSSPSFLTLHFYNSQLLFYFVYNTMVRVSKYSTRVGKYSGPG